MRPTGKDIIDVRVFYPNSPSYINRDASKLYATHENEKKRAYNERVIEATKFQKRIAALIAEKRNEEHSHVSNHLRTRLRFAM